METDEEQLNAIKDKVRWNVGAGELVPTRANRRKESCQRLSAEPAQFLSDFVHHHGKSPEGKARQGGGGEKC